MARTVCVQLSVEDMVYSVSNITKSDLLAFRSAVVSIVNSASNRYMIVHDRCSSDIAFTLIFCNARNSKIVKVYLDLSVDESDPDAALSVLAEEPGIQSQIIDWYDQSELKKKIVQRNTEYLIALTEYRLRNGL